MGTEVDGIEKRYKESKQPNHDYGVFGRGVAGVGATGESALDIINGVISDSKALQKAALDGFSLVNPDGTPRKGKGGEGEELEEKDSAFAADQVTKEEAVAGRVVLRIRVRIRAVFKGVETDEKDFIAIGKPEVDPLTLTTPTDPQGDDPPEPEVLAMAVVLRKVANGEFNKELPGRTGGFSWGFEDGNGNDVLKAIRTGNVRGGVKDLPTRVRVRSEGGFGKLDAPETILSFVPGPLVNSPDYEK